MGKEAVRAPARQVWTHASLARANSARLYIKFCQWKKKPDFSDRTVLSEEYEEEAVNLIIFQ